VMDSKCHCFWVRTEDNDFLVWYVRGECRNLEACHLALDLQISNNEVEHFTTRTLPGSAQNVVSGTNGKIAFDRHGKNGQNNIWVMNSDGTAQTQLTQSGYNSSAAWSPDGWSAQRELLGFERHERN
jgi:hypothetical protein